MSVGMTPYTISEMSCPRRLERTKRGRDVVRPFDLERTEMRVAAHQRDLENAVLEGEVGLLWDRGDALRE